MQSWHEYGAGGLVAASVYSPDEQVGERLAYSYGPFATGTTVYAYHDQLGSVRRWRLANKNNWGANEYQAFGKAYSVSTLAPQDYALHEWDANLAMFRAPYRNYSPAMARWTTEDPLGMVDGPNMYGYALSSPVLHIDWMGLECSPPFCWWDPTDGPNLEDVTESVIFCTKVACMAGARAWFILAQSLLGSACSVAEQVCAQLPVGGLRNTCRENKDKACKAILDFNRHIYDMWDAACSVLDD